MSEQTENPVNEEQVEKTISIQEFVDHVTLQEWRARELEAAIKIYNLDKELKRIQELENLNK